MGGIGKTLRRVSCRDMLSNTSRKTVTWFVRRSAMHKPLHEVFRFTG